MIDHSSFGEELSRLLEGVAFCDREILSLSHGLARAGRAEGLRVLGLMGKLAPAGDEAGVDLLSWAALGGDEDCLLLAGEVCFAGCLDAWGSSALHHWAENKGAGPSAGAQILLALGVDPSGRDQWGMLPMHWSKDPGVWSWSMAALWARGDPSGWSRCGGSPCEEAMAALGNHGLAQWIGKVGWRSKPRAADPLLDDPPWSAEDFSRQISQRGASLRARVAAQNCIARRLGIELFAK